MVYACLLVLFVGGACEEERRERAERRDDSHQRVDRARDDTDWRQATHGSRLPVNARWCERGSECTTRRRRACWPPTDGGQSLDGGTETGQQQNTSVQELVMSGCHTADIMWCHMTLRRWLRFVILLLLLLLILLLLLHCIQSAIQFGVYLMQKQNMTDRYRRRC